MGSSIKHLLIATFLLLHLHMITGNDVGQVVTCRYVEKETPIRCGDGELINILNTTSAALGKETECNVENILEALDESPPVCKLFEPRSFKRCHGERWCEVNEDMAEQPFKGMVCPVSPGSDLYYTNVLHVSYSCMKVSGVDFAVRREMTGTELHITSPYYPCYMPEGKYSFKCRIGSSRSGLGSMHMRIRIMTLTFGSSTNCAESLTFTKDSHSGAGKEEKFCDENVTMDQMHFQPLLDSLHVFWNITYTKTSNGTGGRFWVIIDSFDGYNITLSCDNDRIPELHRQINENLSTGCTPLFKTQELFTTTPELFTTITTTGSESKDSIIIGIVGTLVGLLVIASLTIFFIFRRVKKRGKDDKDQNGNLPNGVGQNSYISTEAPGRYQNVQNTAPKETKRRDVYATVDTSKKKTLQVNNKTPEDTIMYENEDLYETAEEKRTKCRDDINAENRNRHDNPNLEDETIMHENDDLYNPM